MNTYVTSVLFKNERQKLKKEHAKYVQSLSHLPISKCPPLPIISYGVMEHGNKSFIPPHPCRTSCLTNLYFSKPFLSKYLSKHFLNVVIVPLLTLLHLHLPLIIPSKPISKLLDLGVGTPLCHWILDLLTHKPKPVRTGDNTSSAIILITGALQELVLNLLLYVLYARDCVTKLSTNSISKLAGDTTSWTMTKFRKETLVTWCQDTNHSPLYVSRAKCYNFLILL